MSFPCPAPLAEDVESYLVWMELERGLASGTVAGYASDLAQFAQFLFDHRSRCDWASVITEDLREYIRYLTTESKVEIPTLRRKMAAIGTFSRYLLRENRQSSDFSELIGRPVSSAQSSLPKGLSISEVAALLNAPDVTNPAGLRTRAMLEVLYSGGLRVSELCSLDLEDLRLEEGSARVSGKGSKEREILLGAPAIKAIRDYLTAGRPHFVKSKTHREVFISKFGSRITRRYMLKSIREMAIKAGVKTFINSDTGLVDTKVSPHTLRHSFATHMLQGGADMRVIQELLGHSDISSTEIYAKTNPEMLLEAHALFHPRMKVGSKRV
jgi:integrase/recombinase XerD